MFTMRCHLEQYLLSEKALREANCTLRYVECQCRRQNCRCHIVQMACRLRTIMTSKCALKYAYRALESLRCSRKGRVSVRRDVHTYKDVHVKKNVGINVNARNAMRAVNVSA